MVRTFLDANILVSIVRKEYPLFTYTSRILSLVDHGYEMVTSPISLAIAFYFAEKEHGTKEAKRRMGILMEHLQISDCGALEARKAIGNVKANDFEDALQYYSALDAGCKVIVTNDTKGFYYSEIPVLKPDQFWKRYVR